MPGIYLHIPFCKQACHYCDFHFSTKLDKKAQVLEALKAEIRITKDYLNGEPIETIYFGGGTPSLLESDEIRSLLDEIAQFHSVESDVEITLEANPDDLSLDKLKALRSASINRLSVGVQSFVEEELAWMNRAHSAAQAHQCIEDIRTAGFTNFTIDLIYGLPNQSLETWEKNLEQALDYRVPHLSCYALTVEPKTALAHQVKTGRSDAPSEQVASAHFVHLMERSKEAGYRHYEISNFCLPGMESRHNSAYWKGIPYLGIGPSAHSFNGSQRSGNINSNRRYINAIMEEGERPNWIETLSAADRFNETVMTSLRQDTGLDLELLRQRFEPSWIDNLLRDAKPHLKSGALLEKDATLVLSQQGKLLADRIASDLFYL